MLKPLPARKAKTELKAGSGKQPHMINYKF